MTMSPALGPIVMVPSPFARVKTGEPLASSDTLANWPADKWIVPPPTTLRSLDPLPFMVNVTDDPDGDVNPTTSEPLDDSATDEIADAATVARTVDGVPPSTINCPADTVGVLASVG